MTTWVDLFLFLIVWGGALIEVKVRVTKRKFAGSYVQIIPASWISSFSQ